MARKTAFSAAATAHNQANKSKTIEGTAIVSRMVSVLKLKLPVNSSQPLSAQGDLNNWDLALALMAYPPFRRDGLILQKSDVMGINTVGQMGNLIFDWYKNDGWTIE